MIALTVAVPVQAGNELTVCEGDAFFYEDEEPHPPLCVGEEIVPGRVVRVTIINYYPGAAVFYWLYRDGEEIMSGAFVSDSYSFIVSSMVEGAGNYTVKAKMSDSPEVGLFFYLAEAPVCMTPGCQYEVIDLGRAQVTIMNYEPGSTVHYWVYRDDEEIMSGDFVGDSYSFVVEGKGVYDIYAVASMENMQDSNAGSIFFTLWEDPQPAVTRGDVDGDGVVGMDDLTALITYLVYGTAVNMTGADTDLSGGVGMDDLTTLINYLVYNHW